MWGNGTPSWPHAQLGEAPSCVKQGSRLVLAINSMDCEDGSDADGENKVNNRLLVKKHEPLLGGLLCSF